MPATDRAHIARPAERHPAAIIDQPAALAVQPDPVPLPAGDLRQRLQGHPLQPSFGRAAADSRRQPVRPATDPKPWRPAQAPLALAADNAGPGAVQKYDGMPPHAETQDYVVKITSYYDRYAARVEGADATGTLDPRDMVIAEASNIADAGTHFASASMGAMHGAAARLKEILQRAEGTGSVKTAMDFNTYARAEVARMAVVHGRLKAARQRVDAARHALLLQACADDEKFLRIALENG